MAKVETEEPEFKTVSIKLQSQFEVDVMLDLISSVEIEAHKRPDCSYSAREAFLLAGLKTGLRKNSIAGTPYFKGFLTIIPEHIE